MERNGRTSGVHAVFLETCGHRRQDSVSWAGKRFVMPNGTARAKQAVEDSSDVHLAKNRLATANSTMVLCHHLGDPGLGCFRRTGERNDEGCATVRSAIHGQR